MKIKQFFTNLFESIEIQFSLFKTYGFHPIEELKFIFLDIPFKKIMRKYTRPILHQYSEYKNIDELKGKLIPEIMNCLNKYFSKYINGLEKISFKQYTKNGSYFCTISLTNNKIGKIYNYVFLIPDYIFIDEDDELHKIN